MNETILVPAGDVRARIARLLVYPVKSCAGVEVQEAVLTATGLACDRAWMVVDGLNDNMSVHFVALHHSLFLFVLTIFANITRTFCTRLFRGFFLPMAILVLKAAIRVLPEQKHWCEPSIDPPGSSLHAGMQLQAAPDPATKLPRVAF